jgi:hypothetical protein
MFVTNQICIVSQKMGNIDANVKPATNTWQMRMWSQNSVALTQMSVPETHVIEMQSVLIQLEVMFVSAGKLFLSFCIITNQQLIITN